MNVSIAIPCYEMKGLGPEYLNISLNYIANQTYKDFEVVISDHSKDDKIKNVIDHWAQILNLKHIKNSYKRGSSSANINTAIDNCSGDIIKILFQDDFLFDEFSIEKTVKSFDLNRAWLVSTCAHTADGNTYFDVHIPRWNDNIHLGINTISSPSVLSIRRDVECRFDENLIWLMDVDYYKQLYLKYGNPIILNDITVINRLWENQVSNLVSDSIKKREYQYTMEKFNNQ